MKGKRLLKATLLLALLAILFPFSAFAAPNLSGPSQAAGPCNPKALKLSELMDVDCAVIMEYQANGTGFGLIFKAYSLSQTFPDLDWRDLVDRHMGEEGLGWGQIAQAHVLARRLGLNPDDVLADHAQGKGWGQILKEHREGPGKPSWANGEGKPSWAGSDHDNK